MNTPSLAPLAQRLRPQTLEDVVGQRHLIGPGKPLFQMIQGGTLSSLIFWGPPGTGKTTLAHIVAKTCKMPCVTLSAIGSGVIELRKIFDEAQALFNAGTKTLLFVDEIHRFNRAQQDSLLPHVESGVITLVGATTENPSFELNNALLSRCQVLTLHRLTEEDLADFLGHAEKHLEKQLNLTSEARELLIQMADGDARALLNRVEMILNDTPRTAPWTPEDLARLLSRRLPSYDKSQEGHYNLISALHKSLRGSDVDAALYWFARMLEGGEAPLYIGRRLIRFASEDIGMADPQALPQALVGVQAFERLGSPEGELALVQALVYLATAPKSNALYAAYGKVRQAAKKTGSLNPPKIILNAPTAWMKGEGFGEGYIYDHDTETGFSGQNYFPDTMKRTSFYTPVARGFERDIQKRLAYWKAQREGS